MRALIPTLSLFWLMLSVSMPAFAQQCPAIQPASDSASMQPVPPGVTAVETALIADQACEPDLPLSPFSPETIAAMPALQALSQDGRTLLDLGICHGMRGVFARKGEHFQTYYITPDGERPIGGVMWALNGENITRSQIRSIAGTVPTLRVDPAAVPSSGDDTKSVTRLIQARGGSVGKPGAPHLWMVIDPLCGFSQRARLMLKPLVESDRLRLTLIPISINDHENNGHSTPAAQALLSVEPDALPTLWAEILDTAAGGIR